MIHEIKTLENILCQNNEGEYLGKNIIWITLIQPSYF